MCHELTDLRKRRKTFWTIRQAFLQEHEEHEYLLSGCALEFSGSLYAVNGNSLLTRWLTRAQW
jgi:hypothetical protein